MELKDRERKVDLSKMAENEVDVLSVQLGKKITAICNEALDKANALLSIYGATAKMQIEIAELPQNMVNSMALNKKPKNPRKKPNLKKDQAASQTNLKKEQTL